eukprot:tig00000383_g24634.t1
MLHALQDASTEGRPLPDWAVPLDAILRFIARPFRSRELQRLLRTAAAAGAAFLIALRLAGGQLLSPPSGFAGVDAGAIAFVQPRGGARTPIRQAPVRPASTLAAAPAASAGAGASVAGGAAVREAEAAPAQAPASAGAVASSSDEVLDPLPRPAPKPSRVAQNFVVRAVQKVGPAVVRIDTERTVNARSPFDSEGDFHRWFFGEEDERGGNGRGRAGPAQPGRPPAARKERGQGSGIIVDKAGLIITNAHVVKNAQKVTVTLMDTRVFEGKVMGTDELVDLAVVKIEPKGRALPSAELGDSETIAAGDWAIALGNPLGLDSSVTLGIVSSVKRSSAEVGIPDKRVDFIQTDAAINPGNSGGPLCNELGEVVGINTAIRANAEGIGFAIPINKAKSIKDVLARGERVKHPYIGVKMMTLTPELAKRYNSDPNAGSIAEVEGVLVVHVIPNTPAATAGMRKGDVITEIDGRRVRSSNELQKLVEDAKVGQKLKLTVLRGEGGAKVSIVVSTAEFAGSRVQTGLAQPQSQDAAQSSRVAHFIYA